MTVTRYPFRLEHGQKTSCYKDRWNRVTKKSLTYSSLCLCVFVQVQSIENKLDLLLNLYSQCLKKGSSHFTLSSLLEPDLTSDYHSPTDQRDLFPSANTLNISQSESSNFEWQWAEQSWGCSNTDTNPLPDSTSSLRLSPHFEQPNLNVFSSLHFIPVWDVCLFLFFLTPSISNLHPHLLFLKWMLFPELIQTEATRWLHLMRSLSQSCSLHRPLSPLHEDGDEERTREQLWLDYWTTFTLSPHAIYLCLL